MSSSDNTSSGDTTTSTVREGMADAIMASMGEQTMDENVGSAIETLSDDDLVGFALVAMRECDGQFQTTSQRVVDPATVDAMAQRDYDPDAFIADMHSDLCRVFDAEIRDR